MTSIININLENVIKTIEVNNVIHGFGMIINNDMMIMMIMNTAYCWLLPFAYML